MAPSLTRKQSFELGCRKYKLRSQDQQEALYCWYILDQAKDVIKLGWNSSEPEQIVLDRVWAAFKWNLNYKKPNPTLFWLGFVKTAGWFFYSAMAKLQQWAHYCKLTLRVWAHYAALQRIVAALGLFLLLKAL
jgi:hypothetical protein